MALINEPWQVLAVMLTLMGIVWVMGLRSKLIGSLSLMIMSLGALALTNLKVIPYDSPILNDYLVELLLIFLAMYFLTIDFKQVIRAGFYPLMAYGIGALGVFVGAILGCFIFTVGKGTAITAGMIAANSIGGFSNHMAVGVAFDVAKISPVLLPTAALAHSLMGILNRMWTLGFSVAYKDRLNEWLKPKFILSEYEVDPALAGNQKVKSGLPYVGASFGFGALIGIGSLSIARAIPDAFGMNTTVYAVILVSVASMGLGTYVPWIRENLKVSSSLGLFVGFFLISRMCATADIAEVLQAGLPMLGLGMVILIMHWIFVFFIAGKLLRADITTLAMTSTANISGVVEAPIVAMTHGAHSQAPMGTLVASLGTTTATMIGIALVYLLHALGIA